MPLLFLLPFLVFFLVVVALWSAHIAESRQHSHPRNLISIGDIAATVRNRNNFSIIRVADAFEPDTSVLWETQIPALERIGLGGPHGLPKVALRRWYRQSSSRYPELYDGSDFEAWLQFLESADLVVCTEDMVTITAAGKEFLKCRVAATAAA